MDHTSIQPPVFDRARVEAAGLHRKTPMSIAAVQAFLPLDREQLLKTVSRQVPVTESCQQTLIALPDSGIIAERADFILALEHTPVKPLAGIRIIGCHNFTIHSHSPLIPTGCGEKFFVEIIDCTHFFIQGLRCDNIRNLLFISNSSAFDISDCSASNLEGSGITIHNGSDFIISRCGFHHTLAAGILVIGHSFQGEIRDCICTHARGRFNQDAGIHLCATSSDITAAHIPASYHEPLPISGKQLRPHHLLIRDCTFSHCRAQGIYLEGVINCLLEDNILLGNNKEGICFDWGSAYNIFHRNTVTLNGERGNLTAEEIQADFIAQYPLLDDGSSSMKLPGISIDNGCMNCIGGNRIVSNYGGGIKMVRTALFNTITGNSILGNAIGANAYVSAFHGITLLGIGAINNEFDTTRPALLDFMPSLFNHLTDNSISEHWEPIYCDRQSSNNTITGNDISRPSHPPGAVKKKYLRLRALVRRLGAMPSRFLQA